MATRETAQVWPLSSPWRRSCWFNGEDDSSRNSSKQRQPWRACSMAKMTLARCTRVAMEKQDGDGEARRR
eukprot:5807093-Lingulodinium_polyedra.AAC.1